MVCQNFSARVHLGGAGPLNVNLGHPLLSRKPPELEVEFKNTIRYGKVPVLGTKNYYIIRYNMRAATISTFKKCLYLWGRLWLTTARWLSAYMSSRALATTTTSSRCIVLALLV